MNCSMYLVWNNYYKLWYKKRTCASDDSCLRHESRFGNKCHLTAEPETLYDIIETNKEL